ncbi:O-antigen ligase family protein [Leptospira stimsonii]|uniref:Ligase n=1 Tax=Leptospira stimsonii TaxID=2202203 RepID=A0A396Z897_9LEPT|nr:O-antigen ligase family protein [Leptospira stimsonii]RHX90004.1 ligase [Leptospira stimsonii]
MQNRKRESFFSHVSSSQWKRVFWIGFAGILLLPLLSFYPWKYRILFTLSFLAFVWIDLFSPLVATAILASSSLFFGNHPGGRFLELQDCLWIFWSVRGIIELKLLGRSVFSMEFWKRPIGILLFGFFLSGILSLLSNPELVFDLRFYQKGWFWFLHSTELEPWYPIKLLGIGILFWIGWNGRKEWLEKTKGRDRLLEFFAFGVMIGLLIAVLFGWLEFFFPFVKSKLDEYHLWLDGYKLVALPHSYFIWMKEIQAPFAIQSLYWNRSWFAVSLLSGLPFVFYLLFRITEKKELENPENKSYPSKVHIRLLLSFGILILLGLTFVWIGARGGMFSFALLWICAGFYFLFFKLVPNETVQKAIVRFGIIALIICGILFPILVIYTKLGLEDPERLSHFQAGWKLFLNKPLFGGGFESYGWYNECCLNQTGKGSPYHTTHNQWIQIFSGLGVFGGILFALLWGFLLDSIAFSKMEKGESIGERAVYFGSVVAIFVYSFFQEWFYLRAVYLQWIALFVFFGKNESAFVLNFISRIFKKENILRFTIVVLLLLGISIFFFPTKMFRSGIYFPPGQRKDFAWILEGKSRLVLVSTFESYRVIPNSDLSNGVSNVDIEGGHRVVYPTVKTMVPMDDLEFQTIEGENILKFECKITEERNGWRTLRFWSSEVLDPEPRKICAQYSIQKSL